MLELDPEGWRTVPTGVALQDAREQLFAAAERVLAFDGPQALTSRAVTDEAGCAKGVLHRHFADFDAFLAELVRDRAAQVRVRAAALLESAGTGTVDGNVAAALTEVLSPVAVAIVALLIFRDDLRARLREGGARGVPLMTEVSAMLTDYLDAEQDRGRLAAGADTLALAATLVGAAHLLLADRDGPPPGDNAMSRVAGSVLAGVQESAASS